MAFTEVDYMNVGSSGIDMLNPDIHSNTSVTSSLTISVTKKPRYIVCAMYYPNLSWYYLYLIDCENETVRHLGRNSAYVDSTPTYSSIVTSISSSSVTIPTGNGSNTTYCSYAVWY